MQMQAIQPPMATRMSISQPAQQNFGAKIQGENVYHTLAKVMEKYPSIHEKNGKFVGISAKTNPAGQHLQHPLGIEIENGKVTFLTNKDTTSESRENFIDKLKNVFTQTADYLNITGYRLTESGDYQKARLGHELKELSESIVTHSDFTPLPYDTEKAWQEINRAIATRPEGVGLK